MEHYKLLITAKAKSDLIDIYSYVSKELCAPEVAKNLADLIMTSIEKLEYLPGRYKLFDSEPEHSLGIRRMIVKNYLVCFVIDKNTVVVTDILYSESDIHEKLKNRDAHLDK